MTPIGGIADAGSIPAISTKSALRSSYVLVAGKVQTRHSSAFSTGMSRFRRGEQSEDDDPVEKSYDSGNKQNNRRSIHRH